MLAENVLWHLNPRSRRPDNNLDGTRADRPGTRPQPLRGRLTLRPRDVIRCCRRGSPRRSAWPARQPRIRFGVVRDDHDRLVEGEAQCPLPGAVVDVEDATERPAPGPAEHAPGGDGRIAVDDIPRRLDRRARVAVELAEWRTPAARYPGGIDTGQLGHELAKVLGCLAFVVNEVVRVRLALDPSVDRPRERDTSSSDGPRQPARGPAPRGQMGRPARWGNCEATSRPTSSTWMSSSPSCSSSELPPLLENGRRTNLPGR